MPITRLSKRLVLAAITGALGLGVVAAITNTVLASDHQDTPEVELNPRFDINDVYVFPGGLSSTSNIVLVMTTSSPIAPANSGAAKFDPNLLYQFKIDNSGDGVEDKVIQVTFGPDSSVGGATGQVMRVRGPAAPAGLMAPDGSPASPPLTGAASVQLRNVPVITAVSGVSAGTTGGTNNDIRVFAGVRDDPFFIDLEQFFKILPDRRPATGPLSGPLTPQASGFRNPGIDLLTAAKANTLAIVIELPKTLLTATGSATGTIGVWGTISR